VKDRRRFMRDLGWGALAAGLTAIGAFLLSRRERSAGTLERAQHRCSNHWICSGCSRLADCVLPQALSARARGQKRGDG
jgi:hypothetical protein